MRKKKYKNKKSVWKKIKRFFLNMSNFQIILIVYLFVTLLSGVILLTPIAKKEGQYVSFIDSLFTAASAFSDTGLTTLVTVTTWSDFGQFFILLLIMLGGAGVFALKVFLVNVVFGKAISITSKNILEKERGSHSSGHLKETIKISLSFIFGAIIISTFILWFLFYFENGKFIWTNGDGEINDYSQYNPKGNALLSFKCAIFHSISAINNAGFDILSGNSLTPYYGVYSIQIVFIILLIIGGVGFPVIYDIVQYFSHKLRKRTDFKFSLFTKVSMIAYFIVFIVGLSLILMFEIGNKSTQETNLWRNKELGTYQDKIMCIIFHVFSSRNAGFTTLDPTVAKFSNPSLLIFSIMMFIGSAPSSTAGGIRTTTIAIICVAIWNKIRGVDGVRIFRRKINDEIVNASFLVFLLSILIVFLATFICFTSLDSLWGIADAKTIGSADILYEVCSAFGTTGLSTGLTSSLNVISKLILILVMFIGQLGISSTILVWRKSNPRNNYSYIEEEILIG